MLTIPQEPMPLRATANHNIHALRRESAGVISLEPTAFYLWRAAWFLVASPIATFIAWHLRWPWELVVAAILFPLLGAVGLLIGHLLARQLGTRVRFSKDDQLVTFEGFAHEERRPLPLKDVQGVQFIAAMHRSRDIDLLDLKARTFQVNLIVTDSDTMSRINLLDNSDRKALEQIARSLAEFLEVPYYDHSQIAS